MVWIVQGHLHSRAEDQVNVAGEVTSHWIRPCRTYRLGRASGYSVVAGKGQTKERALDFRIKATATPKEGAWTLVAGGEDWNVDDDDSSPTNEDPYPLTFTLHQRSATLDRADESTRKIDERESVAIRPNDCITYNTTAHLKVTFLWQPIVICTASATLKKKADMRAEAKPMGIKLAFKTFLPHHTHLQLKSTKITESLIACCMRGGEIVTPTFFDALHAQTATLPRPPDDQMPLDPGPDASDKERQEHEKALLRLNPDVGFDWKRWWGHSQLESDWNRMPKPSLYRPPPDPDFPQYTAEGFSPDARRQNLFENVIVISYREQYGVDQRDAATIHAGKGYFLASTHLRPEVTVDSLVNEVHNLIRSENLPGPVKIAVIEPKNADDEAKAKLAQVKKILGSVDMESSDIWKAVHRVGLDHIFGPSASLDTGRAPAPMARPGVATQSSETFSMGDIPATHPEEEAQYRHRRQQRLSDQQQTGQQQAQDAAEPANPEPVKQAKPLPVPVKRLPRAARAKTRGLESLFDDDGDEPAAPASSARDPGTQSGAPSLAPGSTYSARTGSNTGPAASQPDATDRPRHGTLKRRAHAPPTSLFGDDDDDMIVQPAAKKTREERLRDIMEEDERRAQELGSQHSQHENSREGSPSTSKSSTVAVAVGLPSVGSTNKRQAAAALSSEGEDDADGSRKGEAASTAPPARKRVRSARLQSSDEEGGRAAAASNVPAKEPAAASKGKVGGTAAARRKAEKDAQVLEQKKLLVVKPTKRKGDVEDQAFTAEFNALKIVKPVLQPMRKLEKHRMRWDENDPDEDRNRLILEDQERGDNPDDWGGKATQMFVIHTTSLARKDRPPSRNIVELEGKYAGRANFKRFRPKDSRDPQLPRRQEVSLVLPDMPPPVDFGLGKNYEDRRRTVYRDENESEDDDDEMAGGTQLKLSFAKKGAAKRGRTTAAPKPSARKGKAKQIVAVTDDEEEDQLDSGGRSHTLADDDEEIMDLDSDASPSSAQPAQSKKVGTSTSKKAAFASTKRKPAVAATIVIDDSDTDDDTGTTFKGFGQTQRRR